MADTHAAVPGEETPPVAAVLEELALLAVRRLTTPRDISLTAASTLSSLERNGPARLSTLAAEQGVSQPSMTQLVQRLEREGLVGRRSDSLDGRATRIAVTDAGLELLAVRRRRRRDLIADMLGGLSPEERREIDRLAGEFLPLLLRLLETPAAE
ncbi:hypothetical protein GCM10009530_11450 [Microbispora corallina]|uniref:HTH marR-type domain-containing protein n=1 Tax=Microbispora corallina TaxID=83302 RepID=A0ABQ4FTM1_9ACTN|nr:MarR family transcriptional regulator [Microbispora corallina]GIH38158.1 hypothetical protein Mco01_11580 [Microbispora corallina]